MFLTLIFIRAKTIKIIIISNNNKIKISSSSRWEVIIIEVLREDKVLQRVIKKLEKVKEKL
jgi:hypothetical protein